MTETTFDVKQYLIDFRNSVDVLISTDDKRKVYEKYASVTDELDSRFKMYKAMADYYAVVVETEVTKTKNIFEYAGVFNGVIGCVLDHFKGKLVIGYDDLVESHHAIGEMVSLAVTAGEYEIEKLSMMTVQFVAHAWGEFNGFYAHDEQATHLSSMMIN